METVQPSEKSGTRDARRWEELKDLLATAIDLPVAQRSLFLHQQCAECPSLYQEIVSLLTAFGDGSFLEVPQDPLESAPILNGEKLGPFRVQRFLGRGGMGEVYEAIQEKPLRRVALKIMNPRIRENPQAIARFQAEGQALALLEHPYIARVFETGSDDEGRLYVAMEIIAGQPITTYARHKRLDLERRLKLLAKVCAGVQHAHHRGILHRDLKPQNILVTEIDGQPIPKIIDFGAAKIFDHPLDASTFETQTGQWIGTPEYMSPEQIRGDLQTIDTRTDVYSLGMVLYKLLVGRLPFDRDTQDWRFPLSSNNREAEPPAPSRRWRELGIKARTELAAERHSTITAVPRRLAGDLDRLVLKALEVAPEQRYNSPNDLKADIECFLKDEPLTVRPPSRLYLAQKFIRRRRAAALTLGICLLALVVGITGLTIGFRRAVTAEVVAEDRARQAVTATLKAQREAAIAQETSRFLRGLFRAKSPLEGPGRPELTLTDVLEEGAKHIDQLHHIPAVQVRLLSDLATSFSELGALRRAQALVEKALALHTEARGESWLAPYLWRQHGYLLTRLGELEQGREQTQRAVAFWRQSGDRPNALIGAELNLAMNLSLTGHAHNALDQLESTLALAEKTEGVDSLIVARILFNMGSRWLDLEKPDRALPFIERAQVLFNSPQGTNPLDRTLIWSALARFHRQKGNLAEARTLCQRILDIERPLLPSNHPDIANSLIHLAVLDRLEGNLPDALEHVEQAKSILRSVYDGDHLRVLHSEQVMAMIHRDLGRTVMAERQLRRIIQQIEEKFGPDTVWLVAPLEGLSELLKTSGEAAEAAALAKRAEAIRSAD